MPNALSISSHVVHGYVGNRAMTFPLQYSGWDVDVLNTTNYSNHPGYGTFKGTKTTPNEVSDIFEGLSAIFDFKNEYDLIITGYTPTAEMLKAISEGISQTFKNGSGVVSENHKRPVWVLDPVLGDNGKLYVSEDLIPVYKSILASGYLTLITPNQLEFEILSESSNIDSSFQSVKAAFDAFGAKYPNVPNIVLTSVVISEKMYSFGKNAKGEIFYIEVNQIGCSFNGCGDLFTALLANEFYQNGIELTPQVLGNVLFKLNKILQHTHQCETVKQNGKPFKVVKDLRIISSREVLNSPATTDFLVTYL